MSDIRDITLDRVIKKIKLKNPFLTNKEIAKFLDTGLKFKESQTNSHQLRKAFVVQIIHSVLNKVGTKGKGPHTKRALIRNYLNSKNYKFQCRVFHQKPSHKVGNVEKLFSTAKGKLILKIWKKKRKPIPFN
jgi:hypothetical protein